MGYNKKAFDAEYHKQNLIQKKISFNKKNQDDMELLAYLEQKPNFSQYTKNLIRKDMNENNG